MLNLNTQSGIAAQPPSDSLFSPEASSEPQQQTKQDYRKEAAELKRLAASYFPKPILSLAPALHFAAFSGSTEALKQMHSPLLFESKDAKGLTPLHYALAAGQKEVIRLLIEKTDLSYTSPDGNSYLHFAALSADPEILDLFLSRGIDPALRNNDHFSAAHLWAIVSDDLQGIQKLSFPNTAETLQFTPLDLMMLKKADAENLLSDSEWKLFMINLADLSVIGLSFLLAQNKIDNLLATVTSYAHSGLSLAKAVPITRLTASSPKLAENTTPQAFLMYRLFGSMASATLLSSFAQSVFSSLAVAKHALQNIPNKKQASWKHLLAASGVRLLNTSCSLFDTYLTTCYPRHLDQPEACNYRYQWTIKRMSPLDRLTDPILTQGLANKEKQDSFKCSYNYDLIANPENPTRNCEEFKPYYRTLSRLFHPDTKPEDPRALEAFHNLVLLKEYYCKT